MAAAPIALEQSVERPVFTVRIPQVPTLVKLCPYVLTLSSSYQFGSERMCPYAGMRDSGKAMNFGGGCACSLDAYNQFIGIRKP